MTSVMDDNQQPESQFPIRELSARTQVNTVTLRAWERRYGLLKPKRTPKGHRLYSSKDVETIERILTLVARGVPIGKVKTLLKSDVAVDSQVTEEGNWQQNVAQLLAALRLFSVSKIEYLIHNSFTNYPAHICNEHLLTPLFADLGLLDDHGAALGFAESELVRYALIRSSVKVTKPKEANTVVLVAGHQTPIWRLAAMALELTDAKFSVHLLSRPFSVAAAIELTKSFGQVHLVFYQDGLWKDLDQALMAGLLVNSERLFLCGTAPVLANLAADGRVFENLKNCICSLIKRQSLLRDELR